MTKRDSANPSFMLAQAQAFRKSAILAHENGFLMPAHVQAILATEILLKTGAQIVHGDFLHTHDLQKLYGDLPEVVQRDILAAFRRYSAQANVQLEDPDATLNQIIDESRHDFTDVRYVFQRASDTKDHDVHEPWPLLESVREGIRAIAIRAKVRAAKPKYTIKQHIKPDASS